MGRPLPRNGLRLNVSVRRPERVTAAAVVIDCKDLDDPPRRNLFERDVEVRPGEAYRVTLPVASAAWCSLELSKSRGPSTEREASRPDTDFPGRLSPFRPSLAGEIKDELTPL